MTVLAATYLVITALCFLMGLGSAWVSSAPGWHQERALAGIFLVIGFYCIGNYFQAHDLFSDGVVAWVTRLQLFFAGGYVILQMHAIHHAGLAWSRRVDLTLSALVAVASLSVLIPGWAFGDEVIVRHFWIIDETMREPRPGPGSSLLNLLAMTSISWSFASAARGAWRGLPQGRVQAVVMFLMILGAGMDVATVEGWSALPYLSPLFWMVSSAILGAQMMHRFVQDAARLDKLTRNLEQQVQDRSHAFLLAREELGRAERVGALGHMVASVAHEINNPTAVIQTSLELLLEGAASGALSPDEREALEDSLQAARRISSMTRELLDAGAAAAASPESLQSVSVLAATQQALDGLMEHEPTRRGVQVELHIPADLCARSQHDLLVQILRKQMQHALRAMDGIQEIARLRVSAARRGEEVEVRVEDNGPGLTQGQVDALFVPGRAGAQVNPGQLGLALVYGLTRSLGGQLRVTSDLGFGTRYLTTLPASDRPPDHRPARSHTHASSAVLSARRPGNRRTLQNLKGVQPG